LIYSSEGISVVFLENGYCYYPISQSPMTGWLPECWYDWSFGDLVGVGDIFFATKVEREKERRDMFQQERGIELLQINSPG
jgi:hypothetical protein